MAFPGSVVSKVQGSRLGTPPYADLGGGISGGGFLGTAHSGFKTNGKGRYDMAKQSRFDKRYASREGLLKSFDSLRRDCDQSGSMAGLDAFNRQAFEIIHSERLAKALDLKNEKPEVIERYGKKGQNYLLARRVVEAGARFVTVSSGVGIRIGIISRTCGQVDCPSLTGAYPILSGICVSGPCWRT